jgi:serine phosphatase RsbU (regulator of sigma subunit)
MSPDRDKFIARKFKLFSFVLFAVVLVLSMTVFIFSSIRMGYQTIEKATALTAETSKLRLADMVNSEVLEVVKLANMTSVQQYFINPTDGRLRDDAYAEFAGYQSQLTEGSDFFWISDTNKIFYNTTSEPYLMNPDAPENYWYNMTLYETELYNFNVNYNAEMNKIGIWVNVPVFSATTFNEEPRPVGMLGCGVDISAFVRELSEDTDQNSDILVFNDDGEIMISADLDAASRKAHIAEILPVGGERLYDLSKTIDTQNPLPKTFTSGGVLYLADYIPSIDWYVAVTYPVTAGTLFANSMTTVYFIMLAVLAAVLVISNVFVSSIDKSLQIYIKNFAIVTADKERIAAELNVATQIQSGMLPTIFPAFPERDEFDIYAAMLPAKEVGGDFYDFFLINDKTLGIVIADVSGKGVPAALFMVIAKTLLKNNAQYGKSPSEVFESVNNLLCDNNEADMFVTCFMGFLDIESGKFTYVNAGHNPPLIMESGKSFEYLPTKRGFVLAGMSDITYTESSITLMPGDELFLYTDGVTEAQNKAGELFTEARLLETADRLKDLPLNDFTHAMKKELDGFADGAEQADDITMLILKYKGKHES